MNPSGGSDFLKVTQRGGLEPASDSQTEPWRQCCIKLPSTSYPALARQGVAPRFPVPPPTPLCPQLYYWTKSLGLFRDQPGPGLSVSYTSFSLGFVSPPPLLASSGCVHFSCSVCLCVCFLFLYLKGVLFRIFKSLC